MAWHERTIKVAFDEISGEVVEAEQIFDNKKDAFAVRKQFHKDEIKLFCCECDQKLNVSTSKYDRLHFKHQPGHRPCILSDGRLTPKEIEAFTQIHLAKESPRHKELKNKIGTRLALIPGVEIESISIDNKFLNFGEEKRRPDVYCKYSGKQLAFEIQLSNLSLRYIISRYDFYKKNGIYLIWILDNFNIHDQTQLTRDIKYLTKYENFFKLDETVEPFMLDCRYKYPFLTGDNKLLTKWLNKSVSLSEIHFDTSEFQIFYYNFGDNKRIREQEQAENAAKMLEAEKKRITEQKLASAKQKSQEIIDEIKAQRGEYIPNFGYAQMMIEELDEFELEHLSSRINITRKEEPQKPALNHWLGTAKRTDLSFINFLLRCEPLHLEVNQTDSNGVTALQEIYQNDNLAKSYTVMKLLTRGYNFTKADVELLQSLSSENDGIKNDILNFTLCDKLNDRSLVNVIHGHLSVFHILESAKRGSIVGFSYKPEQWSAFANNAIQYHSEYWEYFELAFKHYGIWDKIIQADKKGTFQKKLSIFYTHLPSQKYDIDEAVQELYPEIA